MGQIFTLFFLTSSRRSPTVSGCNPLSLRFLFHSSINAIGSERILDILVSIIPVSHIIPPPWDTSQICLTTLSASKVHRRSTLFTICLLYTSDAADDLLCVDLGGRRIIK